jgi:Protein of unknown function (DUF1153)
MRTATRLDFSEPVDDCIDGNEVIDRLSQKPELPFPGQRWTVRRKATVIEAVRRGWISIDELTRRYHLSIDEFVAWERDLNRYGVAGLRTTRFQIYRDTERAPDMRTLRLSVAISRDRRYGDGSIRPACFGASPAIQNVRIPHGGCACPGSGTRPMPASGEPAISPPGAPMSPKARSDGALKGSAS